MKLSPHGLTLSIKTSGIRSLVGIGRQKPSNPIQCSTSGDMRQASPKAISRRTSYRRVRLEFLPYPQVIPQFCTADGFGPPLDFRQDSSCPWVAHSASGLFQATRPPNFLRMFLKLFFKNQFILTATT